MAYTNTDTNMTTSAGLAPGMQEYYNRELLREFEPNLNFREHGLVILKTEVTYVKEIWLARPVEVRTWTSVVGTKSFELTQEAWQDGELCAVGKTIFCGFDFTVHKSEPISPEFRAVLEKYRFDPTAQEAE